MRLSHLIFLIVVLAFGAICDWPHNPLLSGASNAILYLVGAFAAVRWPPQP